MGSGIACDPLRDCESGYRSFRHNLHRMCRTWQRSVCSGQIRRAFAGHPVPGQPGDGFGVRTARARDRRNGVSSMSAKALAFANGDIIGLAQTSSTGALYPDRHGFLMQGFRRFQADRRSRQRYVRYVRGRIVEYAQSTLRSGFDGGL